MKKPRERYVKISDPYFPMLSIYQDLILDHYHNPRCRGHLDHATETADGANLSCGDRLHMEISVKNDILESIRFEGSGCAISQASASILAEYAEGKSVEMMALFSVSDLLALIGIELSPARLKCALLSLETLQKAVHQHH